MNEAFRAEIQDLVVKALRQHGPDHLDARGWCTCSKECCLRPEGCRCDECVCAGIGQCEADDGCARCRNCYSYTLP